MVEEEKFFAWLDGELPPAEAAEVERQVAADPELSRRAEEHRAMAANLRHAFDVVAAAPVPEHLESAVRDDQPNVIRLDDWRRRLLRPFVGPVPQWAAMAATLALGIAVGTTISAERASSPVEIRGGQLYAAGAVDQALEHRLASAGAQAAVRIGLTFRDRSGAICRSFESSAASGLACRRNGDWQVRGLFPSAEGADAEYRMAAGADPRLMDMIDATMSGEPFDASAEKTARDRAWR